jgi:hypothetical protein
VFEDEMRAEFPGIPGDVLDAKFDNDFASWFFEYVRSD